MVSAHKRNQTRTAALGEVLRVQRLFSGGAARGYPLCAVKVPFHTNLVSLFVIHQWDRLFAVNGSLHSLQPADLLAPLTDPTLLALCRLGRLLRSFRSERSSSPPSGMTTVAIGQVLLAGPSPAGLAASFAALYEMAVTRQQ
jgi:hypothetical protein